MTEFTSRHRVDAFESMRAGGVLLLDLEMLEISAAGVRARLAAGEPVDDLLPEGVANYIRAHSLYGVVSDP
jgi:nicotinate-nucleotide adenylyltransferase